MFSALKQIFEILDHRERRVSIAVFAVMLVSAAFEAAGVASVLPFIAVISNPEVIETQRYLALAYEYFSFESVDDFLFWLGVFSFLMLMSSLVVRALSTWLQLRFSKMRMHTVGSRIMAAYLNQPYEWFLHRHSSEFSTRILNDVNSFVTGALSPAFQIVALSLVVAGMLGLLLLVEPLLAITLALTLGGMYGLLYWLVKGYMGRTGVRRAACNNQRFHVVSEAFSGIKDVIVASLQQAYLARFTQPSRKLARLDATMEIISKLPSYGVQALVFGSMILALLYLMGSRSSIDKALPVVALFALAGYRVLPALQEIYRLAAQIRYWLPIIEKIHDDVQTLSEFRARGTQIEPIPLRSQLQLKQIVFAYAGTEANVIDGLDLEVRAGTSVGIVGATGCGKSTLVDIVLGLLVPQQGRLLVDGIEIGSDNAGAWQRSIGYVSQQIFLSDGTIASNIAFGLLPEQIDMTAVVRAATVASIHEFISEELPDGYETDVGERGVRLSGGQRQRIGIARALYRNPDVIILDEATSALDSLTEQSVVEGIRQLGGQKTIISIAHRLSTIQTCDEIIMLNKGRIVGRGSYADLVETNSEFRLMTSGMTAHAAVNQ
jgi:ATP-binding cassette, subfamily B, bacterial PglK